MVSRLVEKIDHVLPGVFVWKRDRGSRALVQYDAVDRWVWRGVRWWWEG